MIAVHYDVVTVLPLRALIKIISEDALRKAHTLPMQTAEYILFMISFPKKIQGTIIEKTMIIYPNHY